MCSSTKQLITRAYLGRDAIRCGDRGTARDHKLHVRRSWLLRRKLVLLRAFLRADLWRARNVRLHLSCEPKLILHGLLNVGGLGRSRCRAPFRSQLLHDLLRVEVWSLRYDCWTAGNHKENIRRSCILWCIRIFLLTRFGGRFGARLGGERAWSEGGAQRSERGVLLSTPSSQHTPSSTTQVRVEQVRVATPADWCSFFVDLFILNIQVRETRRSCHVTTCKL